MLKFALMGALGALILFLHPFGVHAQEPLPTDLPPLDLNEISELDLPVDSPWSIQSVTDALRTNQTQGNVQDIGQQPLIRYARLLVQAISENGWDLYSLRFDGSDVLRLTSHPAPDINPHAHDGNREIVFASDRTGNREIFKVPADGSRPPQQLTDNPAMDDWPVWSPDGEQIAFASNRDGQWEIYTMYASGWNPVSKSDDPTAHDVMPIWLDNEHLLWIKYSDSRNSTVQVMSLDARTNMSVIDGRMKTIQHPRIVHRNGKRYLIVDVDLDDDGWQELAICHLPHLTCENKAFELLHDDPDSQFVDFFSGVGVPILQPSDNSETVLFTRLAYREENGKFNLEDIRTDRARITDQPRLRDVETVAPIAVGANWYRGDFEPPQVRIVPLPEYVKLEGERGILRLYLEGHDPGGSGAIEIISEAIVGDYSRQEFPWCALTGSFYDARNLRNIFAEQSTLTLRIKTRDALGNESAWSEPASAKLYWAVADLQVVDIYGNPLPGIDVLSPSLAPSLTSTNSRGKTSPKVLAYYGRVGIDITHPGFTRVKTSLSLCAGVCFDFGPKSQTVILYPNNEQFVHGKFGSDQWQEDWTTVEGEARRIASVLLLGKTSSSELEGRVTRTLDLSAIERPHLSFRVVKSGIFPDEDGRLGKIHVRLESSGTVTDLLTISLDQEKGELVQNSTFAYIPPDLDILTYNLSPWSSKTVTLTFENDAGAKGSYVYIDDLSLGSWSTPVIESVSVSGTRSLTETIQPYEPLTIHVSGKNLLSQSTIHLGQYPPASLTWIDDGNLLAHFPEGLPAALYTLHLIGPAQIEAVLPAALSVGFPVFMPRIQR